MEQETRLTLQEHDDDDDDLWHSLLEADTLDVSLIRPEILRCHMAY